MIGVANHHHTAAIAPNDMSNSASGVRRVIGSVLREGSVDYLLAGGLPRGQSQMPVIGPVRPAALRPHDRMVTLLDKIRNSGHGISWNDSAALETQLDAIKRRVRRPSRGR